MPKKKHIRITANFPTDKGRKFEALAKRNRRMPGTELLVAAEHYMAQQPVAKIGRAGN